MSDKEIAGVVVIYNTGTEIVNNINTYLKQVGRLYVIDNSDLYNESLINKLQAIKSVVYIPNIGNPGIAHALNIAADQATKDKFSYLLTMDDDSQAPPNLISTMVSFIDSHVEPEKIGIVSAAHSTSPFHGVFKEVNLTMTSGNLLNLHAYHKVGPFAEDLFIDHVDHEYNLRLCIKGFKIIEIADLKLKHNLGIEKQFGFHKLNIKFISHSPIRLYYFIRNGVYISRKYFNLKPITCLRLLYLIIKEVVKSCLVESQKRLRLLYVWKAVLNGWNGNLGKLNK